MNRQGMRNRVAQQDADRRAWMKRLQTVVLCRQVSVYAASFVDALAPTSFASASFTAELTRILTAPVCLVRGGPGQSPLCPCKPTCTAADHTGDDHDF